MRNKRRLAAFIAAAVLLLAGVACIIVGRCADSGYGQKLPSLTPSDVTEDKLGSYVSFGFLGWEVLPVGGGAFVCFAENDETFTPITVYAVGELGSQVDMMFSVGERENNANVGGTLRECGAELRARAQNAIKDYINMINEYEEDGAKTDADEIAEMVSPLCIELTYIEGINGSGLWVVTGIALIAAAVVVLLCGIFTAKRTLIVFGVVLAVILIAAFILLRDRIRSLLSVRKAADGFYTMTCYGDYSIDEYLGANVSSIEQLIEWMSGKSGNILSADDFKFGNFGCSSFSASDPDGRRLMGRNFDYTETDTLLVCTEPKDGYASMSMVDLRFFGVGKWLSYSPDSLEGRLFMLAAPYVCIDGVNEKGVGVSVLQLDIEELHQDNGKPDIIMQMTLRGILDKCASVNEAIDFLRGYDIHSYLDRSYHLFIADRSGRSVVVEWFGNEMIVNEEDACTNFVISEGDDHLRGSGMDRYEILRAKLDETGGELDRSGAMSLLSDVSWEKDDEGTEWSCVYGLTDFTVDVCLDCDYDSVYTFSPSDLK